jgi:hypothetical protein
LPASTAIALIFAANGDNRLELADRLAVATPKATQGRVQVDSTTPLGFFQDEVILFYPLLIEKLGLNARFPLRLRPETEQELATRLWQPELEGGRLVQEGVREYDLVRRTLDLMQLAAFAGIPLEDLPILLQEGFAGQEGPVALWEGMGSALQQWRSWCLDRGLLTYGITTELYWRYLLPDPIYHQHLRNRYQIILADDVDEYPAIARDLFITLLDQGLPGCFTFNPQGSIRLGLGADPTYLADLGDRCQIESLTSIPDRSLGAIWGAELAQWVSEPVLLPELPPTLKSIQTPSRAQLLRQTADVIADAIHTGLVQPQEIAIIGPGVDAIARYTFREILGAKGILVESLNDQQPLIGFPMIRALLTILALVYPGLGRLLDRQAIAEMLVMLSQPSPAPLQVAETGESDIDPVRAGLLTDHCFVPDADHPHLLPTNHFPRWDRLGYRAAQAYADILQWLDTQKNQQQQRLIPTPIVLLDRAIQRFLHGGSYLPYDRLAALREFLETAQHYWDVDTRLRQSEQREISMSQTIRQFIQLLRNGTITADPYPIRLVKTARQAVTLATIFQYRANRLAHRWHFWLDASSALWLTGGSALFGFPLFLRSRVGRPWTAADALEFDQHRLQRQVIDLTHRVSEQIYLCHSDLATNGQEQNGPLLTLVNATQLQLQLGSQTEYR